MASQFTCDSDTNEGNHHFVLPPPNMTSQVVGVCKYCGFTRTHNISLFDPMATGRQALTVKRQKEKVKKQSDSYQIRTLRKTRGIVGRK